MSERNSFPTDDQFPDTSAPQPIPRAGLGIAPQIGFPAPANGDGASTPPLVETATETTSEAAMESDDAEFDPATIPELAPLAMSSTSPAPLVTSRPLDEMQLDEFDIEAVRLAQSSNGGSGGGNGGDDKEIFDGGETPGEFVQDLFSHLGELRARILWSVLAVALASSVTWHFGTDIQAFLARPILRSLKASGLKGQLITIEPQEGFYLYFQITLASAIILAAPFVLFQMWRFIEPALTKTERRYSIVLIPFSVLLFFAGVALGYLMSPVFFNFFLQFQPPETVANFSYGSSVALLAKMLLVFGVCFQVPVVTIFLNKIGIVSRNLLIEYWRHAVVVIFTIVAVITPTWDPLTLCVCATPPCLLYMLSIWLVKWL
jgi:sec-independent protein translocase protein TatC